MGHDLPALLDHLQRCVAEHVEVAVAHSTSPSEQGSHVAHAAPPDR